MVGNISSINNLINIISLNYPQGNTGSQGITEVTGDELNSNLADYDSDGDGALNGAEFIG